MISKRSFLINTTYTTWNESPRSRHQVANELLKYGEVYFLTRNEVGISGKEIKESKGIKYIIPYWPLDYRYRYRLPIINEMYQRFLYNTVLDEKLKKSILINFDHTAHTFSSKFSSAIYYCSDDHIGNDDLNLSIINGYHKFTEKKLSKESSFCVATSDYLFKKLKEYNSDTHLILLGAPVIDVKSTTFNPPQNSKKIKVCFVGSMNDRRVNDGVLKQIISAENLELHIIGTVEKKYQKLLAGKAEIVGVKEYEELYEYLKNMNVGIMPYDLKGVNKGGTPNKYWLYTACGLPSVSTPLQNILNWPQHDGLLYLSSPENFVKKIYEAHEQNSKERYLKRIKYAKDNTWNKRIGKFISILKSKVE